MYFLLRAETRERFFTPRWPPYPTAGRSCVSLPSKVGIDVHRGTDIRVSRQFLHVLWSGLIGQKVACESVTEHMEMEDAGASAARRKRAAPGAERRPGTPAAVAGRGQKETAATQEGR